MNDNRDDELNNQSMGAKSSEAAFKEDLKSTVPTLHTPDAVLASVRLQMAEGADAEDLNVETLLAEVQEHLDAEKIDALIDACQRECLQVIIRPFGVGRVLFDDMLGGNVTTTRNVRDEKYIEESQKTKKTAYAKSGEQEKYQIEMAIWEKQKRDFASYDKKRKEWRKNGEVGHPPRVPESISDGKGGAIDPAYKFRHGNEDYSRKFGEAKETHEAGTLANPFGEGNFSNTDQVEIDHVRSVESVKADRARVLADVEAEVLANIPDNLQPLLMHVNRSKGAKSAEEAVQRWQDEEPKRRKEIRTLKALQKKGEASDDQVSRLKKLTQLQEMDKESLIEAAKKIEKVQQKIIDRKYYTSGKFIKSTAKTSLAEGGKMALQQAMGVLMEEFVRASFEEIRDIWKNGFRGAVDDAFLDVLKVRLMRVAKRVQSKWKDAAHALKDGFISGFLSNLVTVLINTFATTLKRYVRMIREGFMSLYRAMKTLAAPDEGVTLEEAADAALKILAAGLVTAGGIAIEAALEVHLQPLGPLKEIVLAASVGLVTGLATACTVYLLDTADLFSVQEKANKQKVIERLTATIQISHERALEAAAIFDGPALPHLS